MAGPDIWVYKGIYNWWYAQTLGTTQVIFTCASAQRGGSLRPWKDFQYQVCCLSLESFPVLSFSVFFFLYSCSTASSVLHFFEAIKCSYCYINLESWLCMREAKISFWNLFFPLYKSRIPQRGFTTRVCSIFTGMWLVFWEWLVIVIMRWRLSRQQAVFRYCFGKCYSLLVSGLVVCWVGNLRLSYMYFHWALSHMFLRKKNASLIDVTSTYISYISVQKTQAWCTF